MSLDQNIRNKALDVTKSFIVQAPAGSGKTALLSQRVLALLAQLNEPEECLAITFTRKAAAEMRERILHALSDAYYDKPALAEHTIKTRKLALQVLARDKIRNWNLLDNPNRLKIQTIDSLNVSLTRRMPILSGFGAKPEIITDAYELYNLAVNAVLNEQGIDKDYLQPLHVILQHLDNNRELCKKLFISLLPLREQWLPYIIQTKNADKAKAILEAGLQTVVTDSLQQLVGSIPITLAKLPQVAAKAASYIQAIEPHSPIVNCINLTTWPQAKHNDLSAWLGIANLLLTKDGDVRKTINKTQGFPSATATKDKLQQTELKTHKQDMLNCLAILAKQPIFCDNLRLLTYLPPVTYSAQQWQFISALVQILPFMVAQLTVLFREKGQIDLPEVAMAARMALGSSEAPSDLALALDYKLSHILVDEFQDTSIAQFRLLEHLIAGWMPEDGKTLFLVGDPMQSIYRFRQAEVGLFINVQQNGIGNIKLESLYLTTNFRSTSQIITWVNTVFQGVFPTQSNPILGEIGYSTAMSINTASDGIVKFSCYQSEDDTIETQQIVELILARQTKYPNESIAVLVRSRSHLPQLIAAFRSANIAYQGVEIELLTNKPVIQDILSLTKALLHLEDRISWLAILRAPWCGLTLADLTSLMGEKFSGCVLEKLQAFESCAQLSLDAKARLRVVVPIISTAIVTRNRQALMELVYNTWVALSGPYCLQDQQSFEDLQVFFEVLRLNNNNKNIFEVGFWERQLEKLFSKPKYTEDSAVQVMTIHKAKGLEFDTVILPRLGRKPMASTTRLFRWEERTSLLGKKHLIFAPIKAVEQKQDPIYKFLQYTEQIRNYYELARLIYVATTRARKALFGFGTIIGGQPQANSILALIWRYIKDEEIITSRAKQHEVKIKQFLRRLSVTAMSTSMVRNANFMHSCFNINTAREQKQSYQVDVNLAKHNDWLRQAGILVHKVLWQIATYGLQTWHLLPQDGLIQQWTLQLLEQGVPTQQLSKSIEIVRSAVVNTLADPTGRWILDNSHSLAKAEWPLVVTINDKLTKIIIDRAFIDNKDILWIIDYKVCHQHEIDLISPDYKKQLELYKQALTRLLPNIMIKTGLYFPLQCKFILSCRKTSSVYVGDVKHSLLDP